MVRNNGNLLNDYHTDLFGLAFRELFPYGRGHPGVKRKVHVSVEECFRYYLQLSDRQFAQHSTFVPVAVDIAGKKRVATSTSLRSRNQENTRQLDASRERS